MSLLGCICLHLTKGTLRSCVSSPGLFSLYGLETKLKSIPVLPVSVDVTDDVFSYFFPINISLKDSTI